MAGVRERVVVDMAAIDQMFSPGGEIWRKTSLTGQIARGDAVARINSRTGVLRAGMRHTTSKRGYAQCSFALYNNVPYASFVNGGTATPITPKNGQWLKIPATEFHPQAMRDRAAAFFRKTPSAANGGKDFFRPRPKYTRMVNGRRERLGPREIEHERLFHRDGFVLRRSVAGQPAQEYMEKSIYTACKITGLPTLMFL